MSQCRRPIVSRYGNGRQRQIAGHMSRERLCRDEAGGIAIASRFPEFLGTTYRNLRQGGQVSRSTRTVSSSMPKKRTAAALLALAGT